MNIINAVFVDGEDTIQRRMQEAVSLDFYAAHVTKKSWPKGLGHDGVVSVELDSLRAGDVPDLGVTEHSMSLKKAAINSPRVCTEDIRRVEHLEALAKDVTRLTSENARQIWSRTFQDDIVKACERRFVIRGFSYGKMLLEIPASHKIVDHNLVPFPKRVNFFGKEVPHFLPSGKVNTGMFCVNPKYKKAAEMVVGFHPDIIHFVFPDLDKWAGDVRWKNIPDPVTNPDGTIGFYRTIFSYAAQPIRPDLGYVFTVLPDGLKGWLWELAWKLVGFVP